MIHEAMLRARPAFGQGIREKHARWTQSLARIRGFWGLEGKAIPPAPDPGTGLIAEVRLTGLFGKHVRGRVVYRYRGATEDAGMYDDYLVLEFDPSRVDYPGLVSVFDQYVEGFGAYRGHIGVSPESLDELQAERQADLRHSIPRWYPVTFIDDELSRRALGVSARELTERLRHLTGEARLVVGGALLVAARQPMPLGEALRYDAVIREAVARV